MIAFDDMIANVLGNKTLQPAVTELFIRGRKLSMSLVFITQSYFAVPKNIRLNSNRYLWKFQTKDSLNKSQLIVHQRFYRLYESLQNLYWKKSFSFSFFILFSFFLVNDTTLSLDHPLRFKRNLFQRIWKVINHENWW